MSEENRENRKSRLMAILIAVAILVLPLATYCGTYFALTTVQSQPDWEHRQRDFPGQVAVRFYWPMLFLEQWAAGKPMTYSYSYVSDDPDAGGEPIMVRRRLSK
jgi:hypothetical protein